MIYRNPLVKRTLLRLGVLLLTTLIWAATLNSEAAFILAIIFLALIGVQIHSLVKELASNEIAIKQFLEGIKNQKDQEEWVSALKNSTLKRSFIEIENSIRERQQAQESEYQYFRNIVQHVGIGIITFDRSGNVQLYNYAAKKLLNTFYSIKNIDLLGEVSPEFLETIKNLKTGGRKLIEVKIGEEIRQLSVYVIELQLHQKEFKLVSIQNIQSELDEKEMEAWRNLIRVLTHEIMNSVTPISSLSNTTHGMLSYLETDEKGNVLMDQEDVDDLRNSIKTIENRSEGLIRFLNEFRSLTHTPTLKLANEDVNLLLMGITQLMQNELSQAKITIHKNFADKLPLVKLDRELIEQVVINLIKNASESFEDTQEDRNIYVTSNLDIKNRVVISVRDNGSGIEPEALTKIFIPFFTTKKNGSGIGLSLSKEIVRKHQGNLSVQSELGTGTEFVLKF